MAHAPPRPQAAPARGQVLAPAVLLVALTLLAYAPALRAGYFWDDSAYVVDNPALRSAAGLWRIWSDPLASPQYYPLVFTTFWLEFHLWGLAPLGYHAVNLALHAANAVLVWIILRRLAVPGAFLAAAVFALHPVHVESVAWITERKDVLSALCCLLALLAWWRFEERRRWAAYALAFAAFGGALLSKTAAGTFPLIILLLAWWKRPALWRRELPLLVPWLAAAAGLGALTAWRENLVSHADAVAQQLSPLQRLLLAAEAPWFYLWKLLWPVHLVPMYRRWGVDAAAPAHYGALLAAGAVLAGWWWARRRLGAGPLVAAAGFVLALLPALGFVTFNFMGLAWVADHFQYLASIAPIALFAALAARAARRLPAAAAAAAPLLVLLLVLTWRQAGLYSDPEALWRATLAENPQAWMADNNLGTILLGRGAPAEALGHFDAAVRLMPEYADAHNNRGLALARQGDAAAAVEEYRTAIRLDPGHPQAHNNLGVALLRQGALAEARGEFAAAVQAWPAFAEAHNNLGTTLVRLGNVDAGVQELRAAVQANPEYADARHNLEKVLAMSRTTPP